MKKKSQDSSRESRAWLMQVPDNYLYVSVAQETTGKIEDTEYFTKVYTAYPYLTDYQPYTKRHHIRLKKDFGWSNNIIRALVFVREKTFFMGCEDHLLVDFDRYLVERAYMLVERGDFGCIRLTKKSQIPVTDFWLFHLYKGIAPIDKSYRYYVSLQPSVWNKEYLESIIRPDETSWQFETLASQRAKKLDLPAGVTYKTAFNYRNLIEKGKLVENPKTYEEIHGT